jgi:hypothetical protein
MRPKRKPPNERASPREVTGATHPFVDFEGRRYTAHVLGWHPVARRVMGIRLADDAGAPALWGSAPSSTERGGRADGR